MATKSIEHSAESFMNLIKQTDLSPTTIRNYNQKLYALLQFCQQRGIDAYSYEAAELFARFLDERVKNGEIGDKYAGFLKSLALSFGDFVSSEPETYTFMPHKSFISLRNTLSPSFKMLLDQFEEYAVIRYAKASVRGYLVIIAPFLHYLKNHSISKILPQTIHDYMVYISPTRPRSLDSVIDGLRVFLRYLTDIGKIDWSVEHMTFRTPPHRKKIPVAYSAEEIIRILDSIDKDTSVGKRDFAIIILSLYTGLRSVDIRLLKLTDICWEKDSIHLIQHKTNRELVLPLLPVVGNAIADYILHGRPESDEPFVFLSHGRKGYAQAMGSGTIINRMRIYLNISGVKEQGHDGKDFHAVRKTFATNLLISGTPLESVASALGDAGVQAAKPYLALDIDKLRECCPQRLGYPCRKEGLYA